MEGYVWVLQFVAGYLSFLSFLSLFVFLAVEGVLVWAVTEGLQLPAVYHLYILDQRSNEGNLWVF